MGDRQLPDDLAIGARQNDDSAELVVRQVGSSVAIHIGNNGQPCLNVGRAVLPQNAPVQPEPELEGLILTEQSLDEWAVHIALATGLQAQASRGALQIANPRAIGDVVDRDLRTSRLTENF